MSKRETKAGNIRGKEKADFQVRVKKEGAIVELWLQETEFTRFIVVVIMSQSMGFGRGSNSGFTSQEGTQFVRTKYRKGERSRRMWTTREEDILASSLIELVANGWKSDNGFRAGYLGRIEQRLREAFPNTDITATPHINSKIGAWKKLYKSLSQILSRSGVGFTADFKIDCDDEQWEQIVKLDSNAKTMRDKAWTHWDQWVLIFGKDRAIGTNAEDIVDAARSLQQQNVADSENYSNDYYVNMEDIPQEDNTQPRPTPTPGNYEESTGQSGSTLRTSNKVGNKRKISYSDDSALMEFLGKLHADTNTRLEMISTRIGYEFDIGKARQEVFDKLGSVVGLTLAQRYDLCDILCEKTQRLEIFMGMPAESKLGYVLRFLNQS
ncbi:hypothetical protein SASPL_119068 [Salvia splendens]|uniref:Myb/SANT-like domain-containing protein n=2 Tax=Salvia splendens TaxID=180675 RepID=A0A8X8XXW8_SALSN|nr:uncharacterized protein LOC121807641 isoform X1 [Salvia splendens]KAG6422496.1 hypothetical protein SASPL_119068 [Salvia splendens]